ncbi:major facilitator superfamily domain-containing protein [Podospora australis]|uniref:Major facilitator superfamily domain-containing protein n=1 Tax=Podospora australis TaxID=1536484 RepID=A0AAN6WLY6_9PEZI|nr:major facilitator superfamily domain-containing protein [Podospora australis]
MASSNVDTPSARTSLEKKRQEPNSTSSPLDTDTEAQAIPIDENTTTEKSPENAPDGPPVSPYGPAPDGGYRAWMAAAGAACTFFACLGFLNSFGVFFEYYMSHQLKTDSPDKVAWIGSLTACIQFLAGGISGPMFDRYGVIVIYAGSLTYILSIMLLSLCTQFWHFMLAQGLLMGLGSAMMQIPAFAVVSQYFDKKRAAALGIVISGSSIGGVVFPIALSKMLNDSSLGFGWSVRIMGFVITPLMAFVCFALVPRLPPRKTQFFIWKAFTEPRFVLLVTAVFFAMLGLFTPLFYIPSYAVSRGIEVTLASYLLAIVNGASTFGRIIPGFLADKYGKLNVFGIGTVSMGIVTLCFNSATSTAGLVVYCIAIGFTSGTIISGQSAAFSVCVENPQNLGTYIGMGLSVGSIALLIGPPINGALLDKYGGYLEVSIFSGIMCLVAGVVVFGSKLATPQGLFGRV